MKIKYLLIISLILAIITIGAVSASKNLTGDDLVESELKETPMSTGDEKVNLQIEDLIDTNYDAEDGYLPEVARISNTNSYLDGEITLSIDNSQYFTKYISATEKRYAQSIHVNDLNLPNSLKSGTHTVMISYLKNGNSTPIISEKASTFFYRPNIQNPPISVGETAYIVIDGLLGNSGTATLYNYNRINNVLGSKVASCLIVNGQGKISINCLSKGNHEYYLNYTIEGVNGHSLPDVMVMENSKGFSSFVSASKITAGDTVVVTIKGPKSDLPVYFYVDGKYVDESPSFAKGVASKSISGLTLGKHQITVYFSNGDLFYSKTYDVNVVKKLPVSLTLKTVNVKKSAKKLVLTATLKINKKPSKGKTVTFKFNGKTYKAKTNKKGIAKVTIKKTVLKKLKVGKKIKIQAKYSTKTVTQLVKVKK